MISKIINFSIYLLRYFSILKTKYKVSSEINFGSNQANSFFKKHLKKCKFYLEYGSGNSTLLAVRYKKKFISVEGDRSFYNYLRISKKILKFDFFSKFFLNCFLWDEERYYLYFFINSRHSFITLK